MDDRNEVDTNNLIYRAVNDIEVRREKVESGGFNSIPSPLIRFRSDFYGLEQAAYTIVTSFTKGGKTQFVLYLLFNALKFAKEHPNQIRLKVLYYNLEETDVKITHRFMSWLLKWKYNIRISPKHLRSSTNKIYLTDEILGIIKSDEFQEWLQLFNSTFTFSQVSNPTGIYKECRQYARDHGTIYYKKAKYKDSSGKVVDTEKFNYYEQDDPDEYRFVVIDHIGKLDTEQGLSKKQNIDKLSDYLVKEIRDKYLMSPIVIQQQNTDAENNESFKLGRVRPSTSGLGDSKYTAHDANIVIGLFSPARFNLPDYFGYDVKRMKDSLRFAEVLINRDGDLGGIIPLYFDGACCDFNEMPPLEDKETLERVYQFVERQRNIKTKTLLLFNKLRKHYGKYCDDFRKKWYRKIH